MQIRLAVRGFNTNPAHCSVVQPSYFSDPIFEKTINLVSVQNKQFSFEVHARPALSFGIMVLRCQFFRRDFQPVETEQLKCETCSSKNNPQSL